MHDGPVADIGGGHEGGMRTMAAVSVEFCGEWFRVEEGEELTIGRDAQLTID